MYNIKCSETGCWMIAKAVVAVAGAVAESS